GVCRGDPSGRPYISNRVLSFCKVLRERSNKMAHNPVKHQRRSIRLKGYDYSQKGAYFVTICTCNKKCLFGKVVESKIVLNKLGQMVVKCWNEIPIHFPNVELDVFVIMPNHLHGIIVLTDYCRGGVPPPHWKGEATSPLQKSTLGQVVAYFKYWTTRSINQTFNTPGNRIWQRNYYEHVVRNEDDLNETREYVINNSLKWKLDKENPDNRL
ncbi:MAG: transposase, partial [Planctomycetota bacterium]